jgi:hypothetical protein
MVVAGAVVVCGTGVVVTVVVATGLVVAWVTAGVAGVVTGAGPDGAPVHPARRMKTRMAARRRGHPERKTLELMRDSSRHQAPLGL